jgi:hypothetical protein
VSQWNIERPGTGQIVGAVAHEDPAVAFIQMFRRMRELAVAATTERRAHLDPKLAHPVRLGSNGRCGARYAVVVTALTPTGAQRLYVARRAI